MWDPAETVLKDNFRSMGAYIKKLDRFQINNFIMCLIGLGRHEKSRPQISQRKQTVMIKSMNE
jgi:hypothetical protein